LADEFADQRTYRASVAQTAFLQEMLHYREMNKDAGPLDLLKKAQEVQKTVLEIYREDSSEPLPNVDLNQIDPTKDGIFADGDALKKAIEEYNATEGKSGKLKSIAEKYQMDPVALYNAQTRILPPPRTPKKP